jgi:hypothetical protein
MSSDAGIAAGRWTAADRMRLAGVTGVIAALHVPGWALYLYRTRRLLAAATAGGAMTGSGARALRSYGGIASALAGMIFLLAVAVLNALVLAGLLTRLMGTGGPVSRYASVSDHFELLGYAIVGLFAAAWAAALAWRIGGFERRYGKGRR